MNRTLLCEFVDGNTRLTTDGAALLIGITADELLKRCGPAAGIDNLPDDLKRRAQKRGVHTRNAIGTTVATEVLAFLAVRDLGARIDFDETAGQMWAVVDEPCDGGRVL